MGKQKQTGFTIVELLIVIVVIGILAAVVIVAYNGVQKRAANASRLSEANQMAKALLAYKAQNGDFPPLPAGVTTMGVCIGDGYEDLNGDGQADCWDANKTSSVSHPSAAFNAALSTLTPLHTTKRQPISDGGYLRLGPVFATYGSGYAVHYWLESDSCPTGTRTWGGSSPWTTIRCTIVLEQ